LRSGTRPLGDYALWGLYSPISTHCIDLSYTGGGRRKICTWLFLR